MDPFFANRNLTVDVLRIGRVREPVLIIDDVLANPAALVAAASAAPDWTEAPLGGYPGRRAALPRAYVRGILARLDGPIRKTLFSQPMRLDRFECAFSMVTREPAALRDLQRVPHIDIARAGRVAILHYLCGPPFGGTAFFRQRETGLERVCPGDRARYLEARLGDLARLRPEDRYPNECTPGYDRIGLVEARFNRVVVYRSFMLHSGVIGPQDPLSAEPARGRLTGNIFADYRLEKS